MIRKLQLKFVIINMTMVTIMLCVILGLVYNFTRSNLEAESVRMMRTIAVNPFQLGRPNEPSPDLKLPYFTLNAVKADTFITRVAETRRQSTVTATVFLITVCREHNIIFRNNIFLFQHFHNQKH